ncbi:hypothetical protein Hdeb2414_s0013g00405571 [Helianthus debilis subsp. tardiflorus]
MLDVKNATRSTIYLPSDVMRFCQLPFSCPSLRKTPSVWSHTGHRTSCKSEHTIPFLLGDE